MTATILDGKSLSLQVRTQLAQEVQAFTSLSGIVPHLAAVLVGDDPASAVYIRSKEKACREAGMLGSVTRLPATTTTQELLSVVHNLNADQGVHGILVQLPLPAQIDAVTILDAVDPAKDVDCFHPENVGLLMQNRPRYLPCTPHGIQQILAAYKIETTGRHVVVVGRSDIVGKPIAMMLAQKGPTANATVTICHSATSDLPAICRTADILIAAIGKPQFIDASMVKAGACVIDVGINRVGDHLVGDVAYADVLPIAGSITPVPGGVGPLTIAMLLKNTLSAARMQVG